MLCNGRAISRTTFAAYFGVVGTLYGPGDGSTTFNIDGAGKFLMPADITYPAGTTGGSTTAALTEANNGPHTHILSAPPGQNLCIGADPGSQVERGSADTINYVPTMTTDPSGSGTPFSILNTYRAKNLFVYVGAPTA